MGTQTVPAGAAEVAQAALFAPSPPSSLSSVLAAKPSVFALGLKAR